MKETNFCFCVIVVINRLFIFVVYRMRMGYNNTVGIKMGMFVQYRILNNKKIYRQNQDIKYLNIFPNKSQILVFPAKIRMFPNNKRKRGLIRPIFNNGHYTTFFTSAERFSSALSAALNMSETKRL